MSGFGDWVWSGHPAGFPVLFIVVLWSLFWKGLALWHAARRSEPGWFVAILIINAVGLLEITYLFAIAKVRGGALFRRDG